MIAAELREKAAALSKEKEKEKKDLATKLAEKNLRQIADKTRVRSIFSLRRWILTQNR